MNYIQTKWIRGTVVKGRQIGRTIQFPTANIDVEETIEIQTGVYGVNVYHGHEKHFGVMNVGVRPTFNDDVKKRTYEVFIFDFSKDIYDEGLSVEIEFFIRQERAFPSVDELVKQLHQDVVTAKEAFQLRVLKQA